MATDQIQNSVPAPAPSPHLQYLQAWLGRLGLSGKLLAIGGLVGVIAVFLPLVSMSMQHSSVFGSTAAGKNVVNLVGVDTSHSVAVVRDFRGVLCLLGYLATLAFAFVLYPPNGLSKKPVGWAGVGVGGFIALLALWLFVGAFSGSGGLMGFQISVGIGAILNLLTGAAVATGGVLKAREENLF